MRVECWLVFDREALHLVEDTDSRSLFAGGRLLRKMVGRTCEVGDMMEGGAPKRHIP